MASETKTGWIVLAAAVVMLAGCGYQPSAERAARESGVQLCTQLTAVKTGKKTYCGKACWHEEERKSALCGPQRIVVYWTE